jgi:hypothetical protein
MGQMRHLCPMEVWHHYRTLGEGSMWMERPIAACRRALLSYRIWRMRVSGGRSGLSGDAARFWLLAWAWGHKWLVRREFWIWGMQRFLKKRRKAPHR